MPTHLVLVLVLKYFHACSAHENDKTMKVATLEENSVNNFMADMWLDGTEMLRILWTDCSKTLQEKRSSKPLHEGSFRLLMKCAKRKTLKALDRSLSSDIIGLGRGVRLVRFKKVDRQGKLLQSLHENANNSNGSQSALTDDAIERGDWRYMILERMAKVFNTHVLKIDFKEADEKHEEIAEFRHRRRHQMMQMMMFGIMSMGMILVPMGFQFLAVLGGKALVLAKLALILSSIQGLKKVATSPLNYGFYHQPSPFEPQVFEKRGYDRPHHLQPTRYEDWPPSIEEKSENREKIKYRFDTASKAWKSEVPRSAKRSAYNIQHGQNVFPVYSVNPAESGYEYLSQTPPEFLSAAGLNHETYNQPGGPVDIQTEYTIDLPVNKVQFKSSSPFISQN